MALFKLALAVSFFIAGSMAAFPLDDEMSTASSALDLSSEAVSLLQVSSKGWPGGFKLPNWARRKPPEADPEPKKKHSARNEKVTGSLRLKDKNAKDNATAAQDPLPKDKRVIWVNAFPRSGSSMILNMVVQVDFPRFAIFEPCSGKDVLMPYLQAKVEKEGCGALLSQISQCNFTGIVWLSHWIHGQTMRNGAGDEYSPDAAARACQSAGLVAFKTVTWGHDLAKEAIPFLNANPHVQVIDVVRDPRAIFASIYSTGGFIDPSRVPTEEELVGICDNMYDGLYETHPRLSRIVYEDIVKEPEQAIEKIVSFVDVPRSLGEYNHTTYMDWTFDNDDCNDKDQYITCRSNSSAPSERYTTLRPNMYEAFTGAESCREVSVYYGYDLWYGTNKAKVHLKDQQSAAHVKHQQNYRTGK